MISIINLINKLNLTRYFNVLHPQNIISNNVLSNNVLPNNVLSIKNKLLIKSNLYKIFSNYFNISIISISSILLSWYIGNNNYSVFASLLLNVMFLKQINYYIDTIKEKEYMKGLQIGKSNIIIDESAEWLNIILKKFWNFYEPILCEEIRKNTKSALEEIKVNIINGLEFGKLTFGKNPPYIISAKVNNKINNRIILDINIGLNAPDLDIILYANINYINLPFGIREIFFEGKLRVELDLIPDFPHVETCLFTFLEKPTILLNIVPLKINLMNIPGISLILDTIIKNEINSNVVYPNHQIIKLLEKKNIIQKKSGGIILIKITDLIIKDFNISENNLGIEFSTNIFNYKTDIQKNKIYSILVDKNLDIDILFIKIYNKLILNNIVAKTFYKLSELKKDYEINILKKSKIKIQTELLPYCSNEIESNNGVLHIIIHSAQDLIGMNNNGLSDPYCIIYNKNKEIFKTNIIRNSLTPIWNNSIELIIDDINSNLTFKIYDYNDITLDKIMSSVSINLKENINTENKWYQMDKGLICISLLFNKVQIPEEFKNITSNITKKKLFILF